MQGVNRGIRSIWLHMPSLHHPAPSHTCQTGLFPHFLALKNNIFWLKNIDFRWCILAICIPNREVVYLPEQMTRVTLALCSAPYDCALAHCPDGIHIQSGHFVPALAGPSWIHYLPTSHTHRFSYFSYYSYFYPTTRIPNSCTSQKPPMAISQEPRVVS